MLKFRILAVVAALLAGAPALADEWTVIKLRGGVEQLIEGNWVAVARGDVVPDDRSIRTLADGHADLQRASEVVSLGAGTQVQIHDRTGERYTIVQQDFGTVEVEAEVQNVQHFAVETKFLAAVVKGTHFSVTADDLGASVTVQRGAVAVESMASKRTTTVTVGQTASVSASSDMVVSGGGQLPAIFSPNGTVVQPAGAVAPGQTAALPSRAGLAIGSNDVGMPAPGGTDGASITTAALVNPADAALIVPQLRGSLDAAGSFAGPNQIAGPEAAREQPVNLLTIAIGVLLGAAIGALALLFRHYWS